MAAPPSFLICNEYFCFDTQSNLLESSMSLSPSALPMVPVRGRTNHLFDLANVYILIFLLPGLSWPPTRSSGRQRQVPGGGMSRNEVYIERSMKRPLHSLHCISIIVYIANPSSIILLILILG